MLRRILSDRSSVARMLAPLAFATAGITAVAAPAVAHASGVSWGVSVNIGGPPGVVVQPVHGGGYGYGYRGGYGYGPRYGYAPPPIVYRPPVVVYPPPPPRFWGPPPHVVYGPPPRFRGGPPPWEGPGRGYGHPGWHKRWHY